MIIISLAFVLLRFQLKAYTKTGETITNDIKKLADLKNRQGNGAEKHNDKLFPQDISSDKPGEVPKCCDKE